MSKVALRAYNREIENLINRGETQEAIAHCKHILKQLPKHIDTYRLLGKAFLESKLHWEATDILQRVLSAVPDDFVSHLGMSIICEEEGRLDRAIWHLERAFEVQPSNNAIQEELKHLYGQRDGVAPHKVRLTRAALVRMYARGDLYQQAIAEARAALSENPKRTDIEVVLARSYFQIGKAVEATEICSRLIKKLPFCLEANRILAKILPTTDRAEDACKFQQNTHAMDPYAAYISPSATGTNHVPEDAVTVDHLDWQTTATESAQPDWAQSIGTEAESEAESTHQPDWKDSIPIAAAEMDMQDEQPPAKPVSQEAIFIYDEEEEQPAESAVADLQAESELPDWMRSAGWSESGTTETTSQIMAEPEGEIAQAEIPDWLKSLAPEDATLAEDFQAEPEGLDTLDALLSSAIAETDFAGESADLADAQPPTPAPQDSAPFQDDGEVAAWMKSEESPIEAEQQQKGTDIPDWLKLLEAFEGETTPTQAPTDAETTAFDLSGFEQQPAQSKEESQPMADESPQDQGEIDDAMGWLEKLAARQGAEQETLLTMPEDRPEAPSAWVKDQMSEEPSRNEPQATPAFIESDFEPEITKEETSQDLPDWLKSEVPVCDNLRQPTEDMPEWLKTDLPATEQATSEAMLDQSAEELPEWIRETDIPARPAEQTDEEEVPEWLKELEAPIKKAAAEVETVGDIAETPLDTSQSEPEEEVLPAWMQSVQPEPAPPPQEAPAGIPEWIQQLDQVDQVESRQQAETEPQESPPDLVAEEQLPQISASPEELALAQEQLKKGDLQAALEHYNQLIDSGKLLDETINDLEDATYLHPIDFGIWQTLGDAYLRADRIQDALDCYSKAEELLR